jgi:sortase A
LWAESTSSNLPNNTKFKNASLTFAGVFIGENALKSLKTIGSIIAMILVVFVISNLEYIQKNVAYYWSQPSPLPDQSVSSGSTQTEPQTGDPNMIKISSLNVAAPIIYSDGRTEDDFQAALVNGTVHYPGTAYPGQPGNVYIFGHSSDYIWSKGNYKTVFATLPNIKIGAVIQISDNNGKIFNYVVTKTKVVSPKDTSVLSQDTDSKKILSVQTSYPVGTAFKRFVVIAQLQE